MIDTYAELTRKLWKSSPANAEKPTKLKHVIGVTASRFIGYEQHDAQEFLRFFIDALHDDLNLVINKPKYNVRDNYQFEFSQ